MSKTLGLALTLALHALVLLLAVPGSKHLNPAAAASELTVRLLATPVRAEAAPAQQLAINLPAAPQPPLMAAPPIQIMAEAVAPMPAPTPAPAAPPAIPVAVARTEAPAAELVYQAASLPPEHGACSARSAARHYPAMLRDRGVEGQVILRVKVDAQGHAAEVLVQGGSGWRLLDEAARLVALACPYLPARRGEQRLSAWVEYPVRFALHRSTQ